MLGYAVIAIAIGIFFVPVLYLHMYPVCPVCGDNLNSRRKGFLNKKAVCQSHGLFNVTRASNKQKSETLKELILDRQSLVTIEDPKMGTQYIILLHDKETNSTIPVFSDVFACSSIVLALDGVPYSRPLTHDLFKDTLAELDCIFTKAVITELKENTFFANIYLDKDGREIVIDSRPSDAITLALRFGSPIFIKESLFLEIIDDEYIKNLLDFIEKNRPSAPELQKLENYEYNLEDDLENYPED